MAMDKFLHLRLVFRCDIIFGTIHLDAILDPLCAGIEASMFIDYFVFIFWLFGIIFVFVCMFYS